MDTRAVRSLPELLFIVIALAGRLRCGNAAGVVMNYRGVERSLGGCEKFTSHRCANALPSELRIPILKLR